MKLDPAKEAELIMHRIDPVFKKLRGHVYQIQVVDSQYTKTYNMFLDDQANEKANSRSRSTPIYSLEKDQGLEMLNNIIDETKKLTNLTIIYKRV